MLKTLNIGNNNIGPKGVAAIAEALRGNGVLTSLDVGFNGLTKEQALGIVRVERQHNKLRDLAGLGWLPCRPDWRGRDRRVPTCRAARY